MLSSSFPCIKGFFHAWLEFKTCFTSDLQPRTTVRVQWILRNPQVKDFTGYRDKEKQSLKPEEFFLFNKDFRHLNTLKDDLGLRKLNFLAYYKLKLPLEAFKARNPGLVLNSTWVKGPYNKTGKTPLVYVSSEAFLGAFLGGGPSISFPPELTTFPPRVLIYT